jgi:hypothetical protein
MPRPPELPAEQIVARVDPGRYSNVRAWLVAVPMIFF